MSVLKPIRYVAWTIVALALPLSFAILFGWWQVDGPARPVVGPRAASVAIGGPFALIDHRGRSISERNFVGQPFLVFFGFTHCPDVCPTTLFEASEWVKAVGSPADKVRILFVSVDPARDTPDVLTQYVQSFDPRIIGATGTKGQIDAMVATYRATYRFAPIDGENYTVEHTASVFMMDSAGRFVGTIDFHEPRETAVEKIKRLSQR